MWPVGQLSDPFQQGEQDDEVVTLSGLPDDGPPHPPPDAPPADAAGVTFDSSFELDDLDLVERLVVGERLDAAGIAHRWDDTALLFASVDEAAIDNVIELAADETGPLDGDRDQVAYDLSEWDDDALLSLVHEVRAAGIAYGWGDDELYVYADDEDALDELVDRVEHPHELAAEDDEGPAGAEALGELFVAADRLQRDVDDHESRLAVLHIAEGVDEEAPPYGLDGPEWRRLCGRIEALDDLLLADDADPDDVAASAGELRRALRPFV